MGKYQYKLEPRTYKTVLRVIDEFWQVCVEEQKSPTINRLIIYAEKGVKQYEKPPAPNLTGKDNNPNKES